MIRKFPMGFFNRDGQPISFDQWRDLHATGGYSQCARYTRGSLQISTAWVGLGKVFETLVFDSGELIWGHDWNREKEAIEAHEALCRAVERSIDISLAGYSVCWSHTPAHAN